MTCLGADKSAFYIQSGETGIFVKAEPDAGPDFDSGDTLEVTGVASAGRFVPKILASSFRKVKDGAFPKAKAISYERFASGAETANFVQLEGVVRRIRVVDRGAVELTLAMGGEEVPVWLLNAQERKPAGLQDARIRVRGVVATSFPNGADFINFRLLTGSPKDITIVKSAAGPAFAARLVPVSEMMLYVNATSQDRIRIKATVTGAWKNANIFVRDSTGAMFIQGPVGPPVVPGDIVDISGFPSLNHHTPVLRTPSTEESAALLRRNLGASRWATC